MTDPASSGAVNSTIVRTNDTYDPSLVSRLAPRVAVWLAERGFLSPPRHPAPDRERDLLAVARPGVVLSRGRRVATWTWGRGPRVLLVHGWAGRGGQLAAFVEPLLARGFSVATFDAPAHGASEGRRTTIPEMAGALEVVASAVGPVRGIVGHSAGSLVTAWVLRQWLLRGVVGLPGAVAFLAPPAGFRRYVARFAREQRLGPAALGRLERRLEARVGWPLDAFDLTRLARDLAPSGLVVHDREDGEVAWDEGAAVAAAWGAELLTTRGLGHRRLLLDPAVVGRVADFFAERVPAEPGLVDAGLPVLC